MKVLLLTFYYPPDLSAGSFRAKALVQAMLDTGDVDQIDVITTMPNRYSLSKARAAGVETADRTTIQRIPLPDHKSGMLDQSKAFLSYARGVKQHVKGKEYDVVVATSSRLMTAVLGRHVSAQVEAPLFLDIRDLFVDTLSNLLSKSPMKILLPIFAALERKSFKSASQLNVVSAGFLDDVKDKCPNKISCYSNGIDAEFMETPLASHPAPSGIPNILYAGNIGAGQGLDRIVPALAKEVAGKIHFTIIGDGGQRGALEDALKQENVENVTLLPPVPRKVLHDHYAQADGLFLHLNDFPAFRKVLPSKVFEYGSLGKPIFAGVAGYPAEFMRKELPSAAVFDPLDVAGCADALLSTDFTQSPSGVDLFKAKFSRAEIMQHMADDVIALGKTYKF